VIGLQNAKGLELLVLDAETMTEQLLAPLQPNERALTPVFQANFDEGMLREIAEADYGESANECYALLQPILKTGLVESYDSMLNEVLHLISFSEPETSDFSPGGQGPRGHWMRLFACTALVQRAPRYPEQTYDEGDTLAWLVSSAIVLGEPVARAAASMLAWRFLTYPGAGESPPFFAFAILLLAVRLERREDCGLWLKQLVAWVQEEESRARKETSGHEWLLGLSYTRPRADASAPGSVAWLLKQVEDFNVVRATAWRSLAHRILASPESPHLREADEALRMLGVSLAGI